MTAPREANADVLEHFEEDLQALPSHWMPRADELRDFARRWVPAWNAHNTIELETMVTEDITWKDPAMRGETVHGRAEFTAFTETYFQAFPDVQVEAVGAPYLPLQGIRLAVRSRMTGTFTGELIPWGKHAGATPPTISPTGRRFDIRGVDLYEFRDGLVADWTIVYDLVDFSQQIGLIP